MSKDKTSRLHADWLREQLQDPEFAAQYLTAATEDPEPTVYLTALRHVVDARGVARIAKASGVPRESVYRALSEKGNPRWDTLAAILKAVGMRLVVASSAPPDVDPGRELRRRRGSNASPPNTLFGLDEPPTRRYELTCRKVKCAAPCLKPREHVLEGRQSATEWQEPQRNAYRDRVDEQARFAAAPKLFGFDALQGMNSGTDSVSA